ncbi:uncharacterized protein B0I36DRAFT_425599 [Microdochium trichocladiopsis]|uniref:Glycosyltransferase n=1 Tax=Microdochium trichocladiopsis TaxID=1682393 RepID=A0A9P9BMD2_9PEZI|nr:uncharacterized protein B0I36DRAFT_425599 [Microdochium trichocladiopsis]KAH7016315.1 hypothetical protein B0I36DRAFT_425599 [Microdochium trichocladiopsis]
MIVSRLLLAFGIWHFSSLAQETGLSAFADGSGSEFRVYNDTLGFQKVFAIGLPDRTDKRDALSLMSAVTGFTITWIDGARGSTVPDKALPIGWDRKGGHMNTMRRIVDEGITSALIMEDDMDWDVSLKDRLADFAGASREFQKEGSWFVEPASHNASIPGPASKSPYGQDWDMLWIGSCASTSPPRHHRVGNAGWKWDEYPDNTRVVYVPGDNICSFAYALSHTGAKRALEYMSLEGQHKPFDNHLSDLCRLRANGMRCVSVVPSLFVHHRPRGRVSGDSDINNGGGDEFREVGTTENVLYSTRLNLARLLKGEKPVKQWDD